MIYIKYGFIFDEADTWQHLSQFDLDLARFFWERGLEATIVETAQGQEQVRILQIKKRDDMVAETAEKATKTPKQQKIDVLKETNGSR